jgi:hypothetical protein
MTPSTTSHCQKSACGLLVALVLLTASAAPAAAAPPLGLSAPTVAFADEENLSLRKVLNRYSNRAHVVQLCVVCMLLALFIIIKKLAGDGSPRPLPLRDLPGRPGCDSRATAARQDLPPVDCNPTRSLPR